MQEKFLFKGFRWVLGDGSDIVNVKDSRLRLYDDFLVISNPLYGGRDERVSNLFIPNLTQWYACKVYDSFLEKDVNALLTVHILQREVKDIVVWVRSNGKYNVKTGYQFWHDNNVGNATLTQTGGWNKV